MSANIARKKALVASDWTPREVYDRAETDLKVARDHIASIEQQIANTVVALNGDPNIEIDRHPSVRAAKAELDRARLDLSYTVVRAPDDGIVARVDDLQVGDFVNPGAAVFSLMSSRRIWVEANFRETGLTHMRPGQEAVIDVDAYPDRTFKAHVVSMSPGSGSDFAVLPPENATGNWVKVVQRLPVRLEFDEIDPMPAAVLGHQRHRAGRHRLSPHLAPSAAGRARDGDGQVSAALTPSAATDGHRAIMVAALMASYMQAVNISLPNAALLHIQGALSMADDEVGWIFSSYIAASIITLPMARWLAGRYGRKAIFQVSIAIFALGLVLAARAETSTQFVAARVVQGAASGLLGPLSMAILLDMSPPARQARISLVWTVTVLLGLLSGPSIGGWLSEYHGWPSLFYLSLPIAAFIFLAVEFALPEKRAEQNPPLDFFGLTTFSLGVIGLQMLLDRGERMEWFELGRDLGGGGGLGAWLLPLSRARLDHEGSFPQQGVVQGPQLRPLHDHVFRARLRPAANHRLDVADAGRNAELPGRHHRLYGDSAQRRARRGADPGGTRSAANRQPAARGRRDGPHRLRQLADARLFAPDGLAAGCRRRSDSGRGAGHPDAGAHQSGVQHARSDVPPGRRDALQSVAPLWQHDRHRIGHLLLLRQHPGHAH